MSIRTRSPRIAFAMLSLLVVAAGCSDGSGATVSSSRSSDSSPGASVPLPTATSAPPTPTPESLPDGPDVTPLPPVDPTDAEASWTSLVARIGPEGEVDLSTALDTFSLSVAPLPGVAVADAPLALDSATGAVRWLGQHLDELSAEQRALVASALSPAGSTDAASSGFRRGARPPETPDGCFGERPLHSDADGAADLRVVLDGVLRGMKSKLGELKATVWIGFTRSGVAANSQMFSIVYGEDCSEGTATNCSILVTDQGRSLVGDHLRSLLAREVAHCYEATVSTVGAYESMASWLVEGYAAWASETLVGGSGRPQVAADWRHYLASPEHGLFSRSYDAIGFFAHMVDSGLDPWSKFLPMFMAKGNVAAFAAAIEDDPIRFLDSWPSSYARQPVRGFEWDVHAAGVPATSQPVASSVIANGGRIDLAVDPVANLLHEIDMNADIVTFLLEAGSNGRVGLDANQEWNLNDIVGDGFCTLPNGCLCPNGQQPDGMRLSAFPGGHALIAYNGGSRQARMFIIGQSLKDACKTELDPCLVGTWIGADYRIPGPTGSGLSFVGGAGVVLGIDEEGSAIYDFLGMAPLTYFDGQTGTEVNIVSSGIATATLSTKDGELLVSDANLDGLIGRSWAIASGITVYDQQNSPGPAGLVMADAGSYSCSEESLSYTKAVSLGDDDGIIVTIYFVRQ
jgi:hypothetical protein